MLIFLIVLLTVISLALRITIFGLEMTAATMGRINSARKTIEDVAVASFSERGTSRGMALTSAKVAVDASLSAAGISANAVKTATVLSMKTFLVFIKFIVSRIRDAILALSLYVLVLDVLVFTTIMSSSAAFITLYCNVDDNGNITFNQEIEESEDSVSENEEDSENTN